MRNVRYFTAQERCGALTNEITETARRFAKEIATLRTQLIEKDLKMAKGNSGRLSPQLRAQQEVMDVQERRARRQARLNAQSVVSDTKSEGGGRSNARDNHRERGRNSDADRLRNEAIARDRARDRGDLPPRPTTG